MARSKLANQGALDVMWRSARRDGELSPAAQATVKALKDQWEGEHGEKTYGKLKWIAEKVSTQGGGSPSTAAISQLLTKIDADPRVDCR